VKAAVTGWGWRTPLGIDVDTAMRRLWAGERAARPHPGREDQPIAPVRWAPAPSRNGRFLGRLGLLALEAAAEAIRASGRAPDQRFGIFGAVGGLRARWDELGPALRRQRADGAAAWDSGLRALHPFWLLTHLSNNAHALLAAEVGARGEGVTFSGATAGAQALWAALAALEEDAVDAACVVAHDSLLEPETLARLGDGGRGGSGAGPYDEQAAGFVPGEGAAALVLERIDRAGSRALATVAAAHGADGGAGEPRPATIARVAAPLATGPIVVDGAGRAELVHDRQERLALAEVVGPDAPLFATTAAMGQLGAATPVVQTIALAQALRQGLLPPIAGLARPAAGPLRPLGQPTETRARAGLAIATGAPGLVGVVRVEVSR
jgi:3-oxoacyl-[acyl-carrier-protein] synthase II